MMRIIQLVSEERDLLLHQIHALICTTTDTYPVGQSADTHFGKHQLDHAINHGSNIADTQSLSHKSIRCTDIESVSEVYIQMQCLTYSLCTFSTMRSNEGPSGEMTSV